MKKKEGNTPSSLLNQWSCQTRKRIENHDLAAPEKWVQWEILKSTNIYIYKRISTLHHKTYLMIPNAFHSWNNLKNESFKSKNYLIYILIRQTEENPQIKKALHTL